MASQAVRRVRVDPPEATSAWLCQGLQRLADTSPQHYLASPAAAAALEPGAAFELARLMFRYGSAARDRAVLDLAAGRLTTVAGSPSAPAATVRAARRCVDHYVAFVRSQREADLDAAVAALSGQ